MAETMAYNDDHDAQVDPFTDMKIRYVKYKSSHVLILSLPTPLGQKSTAKIRHIC